MPVDQLGLFKRKRFAAVMQPQVIALPKPSADMTVMHTLPTYHAYLKSGGYSQYTPDDFHGDVKKFALFLPNKHLKDITTQDIHQWIATLKTPQGGSLTAKTVSRKVSALNNYFQWLLTEAVLKVSPMYGITYHRITSPLPDILFDEECDRLLKTASSDSRSFLLVLLLLETGIKQEEIFALKLQHFDFSNKYAPEMWLKHTGKKVKKDRKLKLPMELVPTFHEYVQEYDASEMLFPFSPRWLRTIITEVAEQAGMQKKVSPQILRDTFAVRSLKRGEDIDRVLEKLGLAPSTWEDAKEKYLKLISKAL